GGRDRNLGKSDARESIHHGGLGSDCRGTFSRRLRALVCGACGRGTGAGTCHLAPLSPDRGACREPGRQSLAAKAWSQSEFVRCSGGSINSSRPHRDRQSVDDTAFDEERQNLSRGFRCGLLAAANDQLWRFGRLIGLADTSEILDLAGYRLFVEAL